MLTPAISAVNGDGFSILPFTAPGSVTLRLEGSCDSQALPVLDKYLDHVHQEVVRSSGTNVRIDCDRLYFMNSASVKCFVTWLTKIKALPKLSRYSVHFLTNDRLAWQRRSFGTIHRSAPEIVTMSAEPQSA